MLLVHNCCMLAKGLSVYFHESAKVSMHKTDFLFVTNLRYDLSYVYVLYNFRSLALLGKLYLKLFKSVVLHLGKEFTKNELLLDM